MVAIRRITTLLATAALAFVCGTAPGAAAGPSAFNDCTAPVRGEACLFLTLKTGGDDLRGGGNNLTVTVHTRSQGSLAVGNVNLDSGWANGSTHTVGISLLKLFRKNIAAREITTLGLDANLQPRSAFEDPDNWNLDFASVAYRVAGGAARTLAQASRATPFRFTRDGSSRYLRIDGLLDTGFEWQGFRAIGAPWTTEGSDPKGVDVKRGLARSGSNNAWIRTSSRSWNAILQTIPVNPHQNYVLRGWVRTSGHGAGADVNTAFFGVRMAGLWPPVERHFGPSPANRYQEVVQPFNPGNRTSVTVFCGFWGLGRDGWIQFDDLSVLPA
ncbi:MULTISPECIES: hypothetical protein [Streptomyces]|uniref:hypothetical protein n=1 Tax=Streptomyces TaxID=1883 RepID=UPI0004CCE16A|nr:hypothetical protein [Streptomyces durhamensis]